MAQRGRYFDRIQLGAVIIAMVVATTLAEAKEVVVVELSRYGHEGRVRQELVRELGSGGVELVDAEQMASEEAAVTVVVMGDDQASKEGRGAELEEFVRAGGGLVLLIGRSRRHLEQANTFLKPQGMEIVSDSQARGPVAWVDSPLTTGLQPSPSGSLHLQIRADRLVPIARQNERIVAAGMSLGEGGVIVIPTEIVAEGLEQDPPDHNGLRLVVRAVSWAGRVAELAAISPTPAPLPTPQLPPPAPTQLPLERRDFQGAVLYDCMAAEDNWPQINGWVQEALSQTGLPVKALRVQDAESPLVEALQSNPELVVLGSWREYSEEEIGAVGHYVAVGGRLLALAHAHSARQIRLVYLNQMLSQFGVLVCLGRRGGVAEQPGVDQLPGGVRIRGANIEPLVAIGDEVVAATNTYQQGRVAVLDAGPLLSSSGYRSVLRDCLEGLGEG